MAKLMVLADPLNFTFPEGHLPAGIFADGIQNFGSITGSAKHDMDTWFVEQRDFMHLNDIAGGSADITADCYPKPSTQGFSVGCEHREGLLQDYYGVSMLAYVKPTSKQTILFFRGTYGMDFLNIQNWIAYWCV